MCVGGRGEIVCEHISFAHRLYTFAYLICPCKKQRGNETGGVRESVRVPIHMSVLAQCFGRRSCMQAKTRPLKPVALKNNSFILLRRSCLPHGLKLFLPEYNCASHRPTPVPHTSSTLSHCRIYLKTAIPQSRQKTLLSISCSG